MTVSAARDAEARAPRSERCARCDTRFECGIDTGNCWCASLPALDELPAGLPPRCLCPRCLAELAAQRTTPPRC